MNNYVYCAVDRNNIIQCITGRIKRGRYFQYKQDMTESVKMHNTLFPDNKWRIAKFKLTEVDEGNML